MIYALHESLRIVLEEGLPARYARHRENAAALAAGLGRLGIELPVAPEARLPPLTLAKLPEGVDDKAVRRRLLERHGLEIGGGLGEFAGKAWRIGLMGASSTREHVRTCLAALEDELK